MSIYLGIDFGSRTCRTVVLRNAALEIVKNRFSERVLPPVLSRTSLDPRSPNTALPFVFSSLKQELGSLKVLETSAGVHSLAEKISEVLSQLREDVADVAGEPAEGVVMGIPGFFTDSPRAALRDAAFNAGFDAVRLYDEALAAVVGAVKPMDRGTTLVYALGSGVFSATVVMVENGQSRVLSAEGDRFLGGTLFDLTLAGKILRRLECNEDFSDPQAATRSLKNLAEGIKIGLSRREEVSVDINLTELFGRGSIANLEVKRSEFEEAISEPVELTIELAKKAIREAGLASSSVDSIMMVGESTRIPLIERRLWAEFPVDRVRTADADVARGAAWFAGQVEEGKWKRREREMPATPPAEPAVPLRLAQRPQESGTWLAMFSPPLLEAEAKWRSGDQSGAIRTFEVMLVEAQAYLGTLYHTFGQMYFRDHNYDRAIDVLKKAAQYTPKGDDLDRVKKNYHESLNHRAIQLVETGRWEEAKIMIDEALSINRDCEGCRNLKARINQARSAAAAGLNRGRKRR